MQASKFVNIVLYSTRISEKLGSDPTVFKHLLKWQQSSVLEDCLVRIEYRDSFIYQLLEECTNINFINL